EEVSQDIENELNDMDFIKSASVNIITRRAPLFYDEEQVDQKEIIGLVEHVIGQHSFIAYQKEREEERKKLSGDNPVDESVGSIIKRPAINGAITALSLLIKGETSNADALTTTMPEPKRKGKYVYAGSIVKSGSSKFIPR